MFQGLKKVKNISSNLLNTLNFKLSCVCLGGVSINCKKRGYGIVMYMEQKI